MSVLEITGLTKRFGGFTAVDELSLRVEPGEVVAVLGPNGSGKTTTIRCVAGLLRPSAGKVSVAGYDLRRHYRAARRSFAYLPQQANFPGSLTVWEVAQFHCRLRRLPLSHAERVLELVQLAAFEDRPVGQLSGGMRQRLSLAVASLDDVPLMLLDEPTANLDPSGALDFRTLAKQWRAAGRSLLLSTHVLTDVEELADRVIVLVGGKVVASQNIRELRLELSKNARLHVDVGKTDQAHYTAAFEGGAIDVQMNGSGIIITAPEQRRLEILRKLSDISSVQQFETQKPSLEDIYLAYVKSAREESSEDS